jgi:hypothetical protein
MRPGDVVYVVRRLNRTDLAAEYLQPGLDDGQWGELRTTAMWRERGDAQKVAERVGGKAMRMRWLLVADEEGE